MEIKDKFETYEIYVAPYMEKFFVGLPIIFAGILFCAHLTLRFLPQVGFSIPSNLFDYQEYLVLGVFFDFLCGYIVWYFAFIYYPSFESDEVGILIALTKLDERADLELKKLYQYLEKLIVLEKLDTRVIVKVLPTRLTPKSIDVATRLRHKLGAHIVIWGHVDYGTKAAKNQTIFVPINFTYGINLKAQQALSFGQGISHVLANKNWFVRDDDSIMDRDYLARNTEEVSLYILGAALFFAKRHDASLEILRKMLLKYKTKTNPSQDEAIALMNLKFLLSSLYLKMSSDADLKPKAKNKEANIEKMQGILTKMSEDGFKESAFFLEAQIEFAQKGVTPKGKRLLREAHGLNPLNPASCFSLAFLYFYEGDLENGLLWLVNALNRRSSPAMKDQMPSIIDWYGEALQEDTKKEYLHLPWGVLCWVFLKDKKHAETSLNTFLNKYGKSTDLSHRSSIAYAKKMLKKIRKSRDKIRF